jgi:hypothetical protein
VHSSRWHLPRLILQPWRWRRHNTVKRQLHFNAKFTFFGYLQQDSMCFKSLIQIYLNLLQIMNTGLLSCSHPESPTSYLIFLNVLLKLKLLEKPYIPMDVLMVLILKHFSFLDKNWKESGLNFYFYIHINTVNISENGFIVMWIYINLTEIGMLLLIYNEKPSFLLFLVYSSTVGCITRHVAV